MIIKSIRLYFLSLIETITSILTEVQRSQEDLLRKRALRFLCGRIAILDATDLSKETEEHLVKTCKDVRENKNFFCIFIFI